MNDKPIYVNTATYCSQALSKSSYTYLHYTKTHGPTLALASFQYEEEDMIV